MGLPKTVSRVKIGSQSLAIWRMWVRDSNLLFFAKLNLLDPKAETP